MRSGHKSSLRIIFLLEVSYREKNLINSYRPHHLHICHRLWCKATHYSHTGRRDPLFQIHRSYHFESIGGQAQKSHIQKQQAAFV